MLQIEFKQINTELISNVDENEMILNMTLQNYLNEILHQKYDRVNSLRLKPGKARPLTTLSKGLLLDTASKQAWPLLLMVPMPGL